MTPHRLAAFGLVALVSSSAARAGDALPPTLSLKDALGQLEERNLTLAQARARADEAHAVVRQALAGLLPSLAVGGSYARNNAEARMSIGALLDSIEGGLNQISPKQVTLDRSNVPGDILIQPLEAWSGQAALKVPLFAAHAWPDYLATRDAARASALSVDGARLKLRTALVQAATWAVAAEDIAQASERALEVAVAHQASAQRAVIAGTAAPLSRLQAQTEVVRRQSDVVRTRAEREKAWLTLGVLLGRAEPVRVALPPPEAPSGDGAAHLEHALSLRPELKAQRAALDAADWQVASAWWRLFPQLSASAAGVASDVPYVTGLHSGWKVSVDLSWTLYDGGFRYGRRRQAESQRAAARAALEEQAVAVQQQVLDARRDVEVAGQRLQLAQKQQALAQEAAATADRSFEAGLTSSLEVLDANDKLYQAEVGVADAKARVGMAAAALAGATGALLEG